MQLQEKKNLAEPDEKSWMRVTISGELQETLAVVDFLFGADGAPMADTMRQLAIKERFHSRLKKWVASLCEKDLRAHGLRRVTEKELLKDELAELT